MESVLELVGVDRITMPPAILEKLCATSRQIEVKLTEEKSKACDTNKVTLDEKRFRWDLNGNLKYLNYIESDIGNEKLADGIRLFTKGNFNLLFQIS